MGYVHVAADHDSAIAVLIDRGSLGQEKERRSGGKGRRFSWLPLGLRFCSAQAGRGVGIQVGDLFFLTGN